MIVVQFCVGILQNAFSLIRRLSCLLPDQVLPSGGFSLNTANLVQPVLASDKSPSPSTFQESSICFSDITSKAVSVVQVRSMYFNGLGNDSSFGMYS